MSDELDLSGKSMSELVAIFNQKAEMMDGIKPVTRFADRETAEKRVRNIISRVGTVAAKSAPAEEASPPETKTEEAAFEVKMPEPKTETPTAQSEPTTDRSEDMATKKTKAKSGGKTAKPKAPAGTRKAKANGELVGKGSYRDKLLAKMTAEFRKQIPMSKLLMAVYGENRKDFRAPLMMVMKGLKAVLSANKTGKEIRKTRENKENCFGLYNRTDPAIKA